MTSQMTTHIHTEADLKRGIAALIKRDPRWAPVFQRTGLPPLRRREGGFAGLAQIIRRPCLAMRTLSKRSRMRSGPRWISTGTLRNSSTQLSMVAVSDHGVTM